jgi:hypothetical protein
MNPEMFVNALFLVTVSIAKEGGNTCHSLPLIVSIAGRMIPLHNSLPFLLWKTQYNAKSLCCKILFLKTIHTSIL